MTVKVAPLRVAVPANKIAPLTSTKRWTSCPGRRSRSSAVLPKTARKTDLNKVLFIGSEKSEEGEKLGTRLEGAIWYERESPGATSHSVVKKEEQIKKKSKPVQKCRRVR